MAPQAPKTPLVDGKEGRERGGGAVPNQRPKKARLRRQSFKKEYQWQCEGNQAPTVPHHEWSMQRIHEITESSRAPSVSIWLPVLLIF